MLARRAAALLISTAPEGAFRGTPMSELNFVVVKPSKYDINGYTERFRWGFMPNATLRSMASMIPDRVGATQTNISVVDEYVETDLRYLDLLDASRRGPTLVMFVGVQSHQFHRALDLAAYARSRGSLAIIGGPHPMTCDTTMLQGKGVSFPLAEAELVLADILDDAVLGELKPVYGKDQRWARELDPPVLKMPEAADQRRYVTSLVGVYPFRGCPYTCEFCSVIKTAGRNIRSQPLETTMACLRAAKAAGIRSVFMTSDNFNKYPKVKELCEAIIDEKLDLRFFVQCDVQIGSIDAALLPLFAKAGVFQIFLGIESLSQAALTEVHKTQNRPKLYRHIKELCDEVGINSHFSMINGFKADTYESIVDQLHTLIDIDPSMASFYTLCPIPGTEQYARFRREGLIVSENLDRFDTIYPTWRHPNLSGDELNALFRRCYREFYGPGHLWRYRPRGNQMTWRVLASYAAFVQYCALRGDHPMSGGVMRVRVDHTNAYRSLRRRTYGFNLAPLPDNLELSPLEKAYNDRVKIKAA